MAWVIFFLPISSITVYYWHVTMFTKIETFTGNFSSIYCFILLKMVFVNFWMTIYKKLKYIRSKVYFVYKPVTQSWTSTLKEANFIAYIIITPPSFWWLILIEGRGRWAFIDTPTSQVTDVQVLLCLVILTVRQNGVGRLIDGRQSTIRVNIVIRGRGI